MVRASDDDYTYIEDSRLYIQDKDGLLCSLKAHLAAEPFEDMESALGYVGALDDLDDGDEIDLNMVGFEDLLSAYMCLDEFAPSGELYAKLQYDNFGLRLKVQGRDIYRPYQKWKEISKYLAGWIQWQDTYDNSSFRYVFAFGTMAEEKPRFASDSFFKRRKVR